MSTPDARSVSAGPRPRDQILARAVHERLDLREVLGIAERSAQGLDHDQIMSVALQLLDGLLTEELIRVGDVTEAGFVAWSVSTDAILVRIRTNWLTSGSEIRWGDVCWVEATPEGRVVGHEVLERCDIIDG